MATKQELINLREDPRGTLKALRLSSPGMTRCDRCNKFVTPDNKTTEISRRLDGDTIVFYRRCPECECKLYFAENHIFAKAN